MLNSVIENKCPSSCFLYFIIGKYYKALPYIVMGVLALSGAVITFILPETRGKVLPETIPQMQRICG